MSIRRDAEFQAYLEKLGDGFDDKVEEIARLNFDRVWLKCADILLEEFNNDAIDALRYQWDIDNPEDPEDESDSRESKGEL